MSSTLPRLVHADPIPTKTEVQAIGGGSAWNRQFVYHLYGRDGELLYVGIASVLARRWQQHRRKSGWWNQVTVAYVYLVQGSNNVDSRASARAFESHAIHGALPQFNRLGPSQLPLKAGDA